MELFMDRLTQEQANQFVEQEIMARYGVAVDPNRGIGGYFWKLGQHDWNNPRDRLRRELNFAPSGMWSACCWFSEYSCSFNEEISKAWVKYLYSIFGEEYKKSLLRHLEETVFC